MTLKKLFNTLFGAQKIEIYIDGATNDELVMEGTAGNFKYIDTIYDNLEVIAITAKNDVMKIYID